MSHIRVVIAHEPRFYREVLAEALRCLRPEAEVVLVEPDGVDDAIHRAPPDVVICSHLTEAVETRVRVWILLYPNSEDLAVVSVAGNRRTLPSVDLPDLLAVMDEADGLASGPADILAQSVR